MKKFFLLSFAILILSQISYSQKNQLRTQNEVVSSFYKPWDEEKLNTKIPANLLRDDIDLFVKTIEEIGVNPYINITKDSFYREIDLLKRKIDKPLTRREFIELIVPIVSDLRLSHTLVKPDWWVYKSIFDKKGGTYFPVDVKIADNRLLVDKDYTSSHLAEGDEIISINDIKSKTLIDSLLRYSTSSTQHSRLMDVQADFPLLLWWVYDISGPFKIETKKSASSLEGKPSAELDKLKNGGTSKQTEYRQYDYTPIDGSTSKLTFRDFAIKDTVRYFRFLDSVFYQLKAHSVQNLIIDVRGNEGGNFYSLEVVKYLYDKPFKASSKMYYKKSKFAEDFFLLVLYPEDRDNPVMRKLVSNCFGSCEAEHDYGQWYECDNEFFFPKPDSIRFKGNLFVLSDNKTNSAAVDFAVCIKDYSIGKIIGNETNQSPSNDANGCYFLLPHSNVMAMGATNYAIRPNGDPSTTRGVIPDYEVTQLKKDTEKGIDTVLNFTLKLIKNRN
jgi:hypothetical protein